MFGMVTTIICSDCFVLQQKTTTALRGKMTSVINGFAKTEASDF